MPEMPGSRSWREELASLVEDTGIVYTGNPIGTSTMAFEMPRHEFTYQEGASEKSESLRDQVKGFMKAWGEMLMELGKGVKDVVQQSMVTEDSYILKKFGGSVTEVSRRLTFMNEFLPEDRDPIHVWTVLFFVFFLALAVFNVNSQSNSFMPPLKKVHIHPPSASHVLLPDGRHLAYHERGVSPDRARFSLIVPHYFLSSRLAGIPGVKESLLEEFGVRLVTYDLPGFGESDPHQSRNLNTSAQDMLNLANLVGINDKFWLLSHSSGAMHAWAALRYISDRIAGAALLAPMVNPYDPDMTKEEKRLTWEKWMSRRKLMYILARRFPRLLSYFYGRTFLSGKHGQIDKWLSLCFGKRDKALVEEPIFEEFWQRNVEESIRQGSAEPFREEATLQVTGWGFSIADLQVERKCQGQGIIPWLKFLYSRAECESSGFPGPIHIWQGTDDEVTPMPMIDYISRLLAGATVHKLPHEGHFSYFFFCDNCHRQIFTTLFGEPRGPLDQTAETRVSI